MMKTRLLPLGLALAAFLACDQQNQDLPFSTDPDQEVSKTIGSAGGTVSSPAGASVKIPSGAVSGNTNVTIQRKQGTDLGATVPGTVVDGSAFTLDPEGTKLSQPAEVNLKVNTGGLSEDELLALSGVLVSGGEAHRLSTPSVNVTSGILKTKIDELGTVAARVADDLLTVQFGNIEDEFATGSAGTGAVRVARPALPGAGFAGGTATPHTAHQTSYGGACEGNACLTFFGAYTSSQTLNDAFSNLGAINLEAEGTLTFTPNPLDPSRGTVTGQIDLAFEVRVRLGGAVIGMPTSGGIDGVAEAPYVIECGTVCHITIGSTQYLYGEATIAGVDYIWLGIVGAGIEFENEDGETEEHQVDIALILPEITE